MKGFIYILSNPSLSSLKIGKTKSDPSQRVKELTSSTSIPTPFKIEYYAYVDNFDERELEIHRRLANARINKNREFFEVDVPRAIAAIEETCNVLYAERDESETKVKTFENSGEAPDFLTISELAQLTGQAESVDEEDDQRVQAEKHYELVGTILVSVWLILTVSWAFSPELRAEEVAFNSFALFLLVLVCLIIARATLGLYNKKKY